jgi:hypothetical protein
MDASLKCALERFQDKSAIVRRLFSESETFQGICADYLLARDALTGFEKSCRKAGAAPPIEEYRKLVSDLEEEIASVIRKADDG